MKNLLQNLKIIKIKDVFFHEEADPKRTEHLTSRIKGDGIFINPPIVAQLGQKYVLLDGANRVSAIKSLACDDILVQIVDYTTVGLKTWQHVICSLNQAKFKKQVSDLVRKKRGYLKLEKINAEIKKLPKSDLSWIIFGKKGYKIKKLGDFSKDLLFLNEFSKLYKENALFYRIESSIGISKVFKNYKNFTALVKFPEFSRQDILRAAKSDIKLPSGISRHILPIRILKINLPLSLLKSKNEPLFKNQKLKKLLQARITNNQARFYEEPVWIFDE